MIKIHEGNIISLVLHYSVGESIFNFTKKSVLISGDVWNPKEMTAGFNCEVTVGLQLIAYMICI